MPENDPLDELGGETLGVVGASDRASAASEKPGLLSRAGAAVSNFFSSPAEGLDPAEDRANVLSLRGETTPQFPSQKIPAEDETDPLGGEGLPEPTAGEAASAIGRGVVTGGIHGGGFAAGARAGLQLPLPPPARIVAGVVGGLAGYVVSDLAVDLLADPDILGENVITFKSLDDVPDNLKRYAVFGETFGSFIGPTGFMIHAGKQPFRIVVDPQAGRLRKFAGNLFNDILDAAGRRTGKFIAAETAGAVGAGAGGFVAETAAPGRAGVRLTAELASGVFSPARLITGLAHDTWAGAKALQHGFGQTRRLNKAGEIFQEYVKAAGEDPQMLAEFLRSYARADGSRPTVAQALGEGAAAAFEAEFRIIDLAFGTASTQQYRQSLEATTTAISLYREMGGAVEGVGPEAMVEAARLQNMAYRTLLEIQAGNAKAAATKAAKEITATIPLTAEERAKGALPEVARTRINKAATDIYERSMKQAREVEKELYAELPKVARQPGLIFKRLNVIAAEKPPRKLFPGIVEGMIEDFRNSTALFARLKKAGLGQDQAMLLAETAVGRAGAAKTAAQETLGELSLSPRQIMEAVEHLSTTRIRQFRSEVLTESRKAAEAFDAPMERWLGLLADAADKDVDAAYRAAEKAGTLAPGVMRAYARAKAYTFQFYETYTRAFGGVTKARGARGQLSVPPETLLAKALAGGPEQTTLNLRELEAATRFLPAMSARGYEVSAKMLAKAADNADLMLDAQEQMLRLAANATVGPDGRLDPGAMHVFLRKNAETLLRLPKLETLLRNSTKTEDAARVVERQVDDQLKNIGDEVFSKLLRFESPADAVSAAFRADRPTEELAGLYNLAKGSDIPSRAVPAFRATVFDAIEREARHLKAPSAKIARLIELLDEPIRPGLPNLLDLGTQQGWLRPQEADAVRRFLQQGRNIIEAQATLPSGQMVFGGGVEDITGSALDLLQRVIGAKGGRLVAHVGAFGGNVGTGESLIASAAGSRIMRQVFNRLPRARLEDIFRQALRGDPIEPGAADYSLAIHLLEVPTTPKRALELAWQIHAYAIGSVVSFIDAKLDAEERGDDDPLGGQSFP